MNKKDSEKPKFLLYKLEPLKKLEETILKKEKIKEEYIKKLFGENLPKIFSNLVFLKEEHRLLNPDTSQKDCIADTLAFNKKDKQFIIIEYKRENSTRLYEQTQSYISCLDDENKTCIINRFNLVETLREKEKSKKWNYESINWEETKGICIATEIHKDLGHHKRNPKNKNITIIEIKFYDEKNFLYVDTSKSPEWLKITSAETEKDTKPKLEKMKNEKVEKGNNNSSYNFDDIINIDWIKSEIKDLWQKLRKILLLKKWLNEEARTINKKSSYAVIYYWERSPKQKLFSVVIKRHQINIYGNWSSQTPQNLSEFLDKNGIKYKKEDHNGTGDWHFPLLKNNVDFSNLKSFFQEYKEKFSETN